MKHLLSCAAILLVCSTAHANPDYACMQDCLTQGYSRNQCAVSCDNRGGLGGGLTDQPGVPKNPAFDQLDDGASRKRPPPAVADPQCMKDCQKQNYNYGFCQKQCSYSLFGR